MTVETFEKAKSIMSRIDFYKEELRKIEVLYNKALSSTRGDKVGMLQVEYNKIYLDIELSTTLLSVTANTYKMRMEELEEKFKSL